MNALEAAYRRAMRWYPSRWRAENAQALLGVLLDGAEAAGRTEVSRSDRRNLRVNGLRVRLAVVERSFPAAARNKASAIALGFGFGVTLAMLLLQEWAPWATLVSGMKPTSMVGPFHGWGGVLYSAWALAAILGLLRLVAVARVLLAATIPFSVILVVTTSNYDQWVRPTSEGLAVLGALAAVAALGKATTSARSYLLSGSAFVAGAAFVVYPFIHNVGHAALVPPLWIWNLSLQGTGGSIAVVASAGILLTIVLAVKDSSWLAAAALLALPAGLVVTRSLPATSPDRVVLIVVVTFILAVVCVAVSLRARGLRIALVRRT